MIQKPGISNSSYMQTDSQFQLKLVTPFLRKLTCVLVPLKFKQALDIYTLLMEFLYLYLSVVNRYALSGNIPVNPSLKHINHESIILQPQKECDTPYSCYFLLKQRYRINKTEQTTSLPIPLKHTHTHTHTHIQRFRESETHTHTHTKTEKTHRHPIFILFPIQTKIQIYKKGSNSMLTYY